MREVLPLKEDIKQTELCKRKALWKQKVRENIPPLLHHPYYMYLSDVAIFLSQPFQVV